MRATNSPVTFTYWQCAVEASEMITEDRVVETEVPKVDRTADMEDGAVEREAIWCSRWKRENVVAEVPSMDGTVIAEVPTVDRTL